MRRARIPGAPHPAEALSATDLLIPKTGWIREEFLPSEIEGLYPSSGAEMPVLSGSA
jgi:hypothetical protein